MLMRHAMIGTLLGLGVAMVSGHSAAPLPRVPIPPPATQAARAAAAPAAAPIDAGTDAPECSAPDVPPHRRAAGSRQRTGMRAAPIVRSPYQ